MRSPVVNLMTEPIRSSPSSPRRRFRMTMRAMMFAVAMIAVLLSVWIPTLRLGIDLKQPRPVEQWSKVGFLLIGETIFVYYITLVVVIACGILNATGSGKRLSQLLIIGPALVIILILLIGQLVDSLMRLPWV
jgi:hypothetical protein